MEGGGNRKFFRPHTLLLQQFKSFSDFVTGTGQNRLLRCVAICQYQTEVLFGEELFDRLQRRGNSQH